MATLIIEISTRGRGQPQFRRVRQFPYRIGRAYDNDLILHDETVSAAHLQIERDRDGVLRLRNLSHENGTQCNGRKLGFVPVELNKACTLQLGHTTLRLLQPDSAVGPARLSHHYPGPMQIASKLPFALFALAFVWFLNAWQVSDNLISPRSEKEILLAQLPQLIAPLLSATVTGFISRLLLHRWQFALQLSIACIALLMVIATQEIQAWLSYFYSDNDAGTAFFVVMMASVFTALFAWQLRAFSNLTRERAGLTAVAIMWPLIAVLSLPSWLREPQFNSQPQMHTLLRPVDERQQANVDITTFINRLDQDLQSDE